MADANGKRHAYLIMAHHRPDLLRVLLEDLDDPRNDIYLHVDAKAAPEMAPENFRVSRAGFKAIPSMEVNWGGYSQIECALNLLQAAVEDGGHGRVHLMTGSTFPLKTQDQLHAYFARNQEREYIALDNPAPERTKYRYLFNEVGKRSRFAWPRLLLRRGYLRLQKLLGVDRFRRFNMTHKKGLAYWSITGRLAEYTVKRRDLIYDMMRYSFCGDEVFMQTIAWNSPFREKLFDREGNLNDSRRATTWPLEDAGIKRWGHNFLMEDLSWLRGTEAFFALKFEGEDGLRIIEEIKRYRGSHV